MESEVRPASSITSNAFLTFPILALAKPVLISLIASAVGFCKPAVDMIPLPLPVFFKKMYSSAKSLSDSCALLSANLNFEASFRPSSIRDFLTLVFKSPLILACVALSSKSKPSRLADAMKSSTLPGIFAALIAASMLVVLACVAPLSRALTASAASISPETFRIFFMIDWFVLSVPNLAMLLL